MPTFNLLEAKTNLAKLIDSLDSGQETEIIITRDGRPAARLLPLSRRPASNRIGIAEGRWLVPYDIDQDNEIIAGLFEGRAG